MGPPDRRPQVFRAADWCHLSVRISRAALRGIAGARRGPASCAAGPSGVHSPGLLLAPVVALASASAAGDLERLVDLADLAVLADVVDLRLGASAVLGAEVGRRAD